MKSIATLFIFIFCTVSTCFSQQKTDSSSQAFSADLMVGPYLMIDHHLYKSVVMQGARLGYAITEDLSFSVEYMVGQQEDVMGQLGTTHAAMGQFGYFLFAPNRLFRPYISAGGGFFEFKDFSKDVLGIAFFGSLGTELNFSTHIKGFLEPRYLNLGPLNLEGKNELGVFWGIRASF
jgi:hypothetical protein